MSWFYKQFLPESLDASFLKQPMLSPMYSVIDPEQNFHAHCHPPTLICTAEVDVLSSEGEAYGHALAEKGVPVTMKRYKGVPHNWSRQTELLEQARDYVTLSIGLIGQALQADSHQGHKPQ